MKRETLKKILADLDYSKDTINSILSGRRKPNQDIKYYLEKEFKIPFTAWKDIKSFITNDTKTQTNNTSTKA